MQGFETGHGAAISFAGAGADLAANRALWGRRGRRRRGGRRRRCRRIAGPRGWASSWLPGRIRDGQGQCRAARRCEDGRYERVALRWRRRRRRAARSRLQRGGSRARRPPALRRLHVSDRRPEGREATPGRRPARCRASPAHRTSWRAAGPEPLRRPRSAHWLQAARSRGRQDSGRRGRGRATGQEAALQRATQATTGAWAARGAAAAAAGDAWACSARPGSREVRWADALRVRQPQAAQ